MPVTRRPEELGTLKTRDAKGQSHAPIARTLGVTEGTVRYRLRRQATPAPDRRRGQPHKADPRAQGIDPGVRGDRPSSGANPPRAVNIRALSDFRVTAPQDQGAYRSVRRLVHAR